MDNTPYDDVFRTLLTDCTELIIPVVNEIFHTKYTRKEKICLLQNEHFIKLPDGSMIIQMFEYDTQLALENKELISNFLTVRFPDSAIVSLRHTKNTPDSMTITVLTPGGKVTYTVPVLKIRQYTINELFEKKLFFLIPFHIFVYEKDFNELETNKKKLKQLEAEYASIKKRHEKSKNAVSRKTSAKRKHYTICCRPHRTSRRNHSRTCTKYYFKKNSLTQKAETILLSVTLSRNRNMISASAILSIILLIFHKILCSN